MVTRIYAKKVLVMDDNAFVRKVTLNMLRTFDFEVYITENGAQAIDAYIKFKDSGYSFDAVILDLNIPNGMGGKYTIRKLLEIDPDVKAIISSADTNDPVMTDFKEHGFRGTLPKPYTVNELTEALHKAINETGSLINLLS